MAKIIESIPIQNFEKAKNEIAFILQDEINNQIDLSGELLEVPVYLDRKDMITNAENCVINVYLTGGEYSEITKISSEGLYVFNVDIYTNTQSELFNSSSVLDTLYGWVRYILSHPEYKTLGFDRGFVAGVYVRSFVSQEKLLIKDSDTFDVKSVQFECRLTEFQNGVNGDELISNYTNYKICLTDKGYKVESNF